jgi:hypothetical protein
VEAFQHNNQAIFGTTLGRNPRREVKQVSPGPHYEGEARVCAIGTDRVTDKSFEKKLGEVLSAQGKEMSEIRSNIAALSTQMFETMYIGDKGLAQVSRVAPLRFKASLFPKNVTRFSPVGDPNFGHSLKNQQDRLLGVDRELGDDPEGRVKFEGASQEYEFSSEESEGEENNREVPFLGDGLSDCARYLSIRFLFTSSIMAAI